MRSDTQRVSWPYASMHQVSSQAPLEVPSQIMSLRWGSDSLTEWIDRKTDLLKFPAFTKALDRAKRSESFVFPFAHCALRLQSAARRVGEEGKTIST